jgi:Mor family transcriptional regulator
MELRDEFNLLIESIVVDDLPNNDMKDLAGICGTKAVVSLMKNMGGTSIYIPRETAFIKIIDRFIVKKFDGTNAKKLASACGITLRQVYKIIEKENARREKTRATSLQMRLELPQ